MKPFEVGEVFFDFLHLSFYVAVGDDGLGADDFPFSEVEAIEQDGYVGFECDVVEAFLPFGLSLAGAFGGDAEPELPGLPCLVGDDVGGAHLFAAIDGYASQPAHQDAHRPEEPLLLHQEVAMKAFCPAVEVAHDEVPVARVRSKCYDAFLGHRFRHGLLEVAPVEQNLVADFIEHLVSFTI